MDEKRRKPDQTHAVDPLPKDEEDDATGELVAFLDGELEADAVEAVEAKISLDATVRAEADALKRTWDLLDHLPRSEPSPNFTERTLSSIRPAGKSTEAKTAPTLVGSGSNKSAGRTVRTAIAPDVRSQRRAARGRNIFLVCWLFAAAVCGLAGYWVHARVTSQIKRFDDREKKSEIIAVKHLLQNLPKYRYVESKENLASLEDPELFGEEP